MKVGKIKDLKNLILLSIGIIAIIIVAIIGICIKNKTKETNSKAKEKFDNEEILINVNEEVEEFASIEDLEQETDETEKEDSKDTDKTNNKNSNKNSSLPYYIKVNYGAQVVTIYTQDENGEYTIPYKAMVCSTGVATPTSGVYSIPARWEWLGLQGDVYGHYSTQIKGNILFHSVPYLTRGDKSSLEYWEYDKLGTYASAGCIRLTVADAKWIFYNCARGTKVEFYSSSNPGPLGKPSARKISSYPDYLRNWDPTDPDSSNPWHTYKNEDNKKENNDNENTKNNTSKNETTNTNVVSNVIENEVSNNITNETTGDNKGNVTTNTIDNSIKQNMTENSVVNNTINTKANNTNTNVNKTNEQKDNNQSNKTTLNAMTSEIV